MLNRSLISITLIGLLSSMDAQELNAGFSAKRILEELNPVAMAIDHHHRIWQVEKNGRVLIVEADGTVLPDPFITINVDDFNERGLLGIALHPDMDRQPYVYLYYSVPGGNHNRISRFVANGDLAVPGSEEILLDLDPLSGAIHNGGALIFDRSGYLFIATGEAGKSTNSQDTSNLLGKILRINADGSIPPDNPYYHSFHGNNRAIWSMGHRNPFNLTYDWMEDRLYATDVGGGTFEEINLIQKGKNYGWPTIEGPISDQTPPQNYQDPYYSYPYEIGNACAIVGLAVYRSETLSFGSDFDGALFFADYCGGTINYLENGNPNLVRSFATELDRPLNILVNQKNGDLYFHTRAGQGGGSPDDNTSSNNGALWQLFFKGDGSPEIVNSLPNMVRVVGEDVFFEIKAIGTDTLTYQWRIDQQRITQANSSSLVLESLDISQHGSKISCIVTNAEGSDTSNLATLTVLDNNRPEISIAHPLNGQLFRAGDTILFSGSALDHEDGVLSPAQLSWNLEFHHNDHTHPLLDVIGNNSGTVVIPTNGETSSNVWIRIHLSAKDNDGLENQTFVEIYPEFSSLTFKSLHPATISIDGAKRTLPTTVPSMIGLSRSIEIAEVQNKGGQLLSYRAWSDGYQDNIRTIRTAPTADTFSIEFDVIPLGTGTGLSAEYWNGEETPEDNRPPDLVRIDSVIDFGWDNKSPDESKIDRDFFFGRWQGFLEAPFSEEYTLSIASDDGARMWIGDDLIFEHWQPQATTEHFFTYVFEAGKKYPIRIEYFERDGGAAIHLRWQSMHTAREIIPKLQLYPKQVGVLAGILWLDREEDGQYHGNEETLPGASVILLDDTYRLVSFVESDQMGRFQFEALIGKYLIHVINPEGYRQWQPNSGLDAFGYSNLQLLNPDTMLFIPLGFVEDQATSTTAPKLNLIRIMPNPVRSILKIEAAVQISQVTIYDITGKIEFLKSMVGADQTALDVQHLSPGTYLIALQTGRGIQYEKFIKH